MAASSSSSTPASFPQEPIILLTTVCKLMPIRLDSTNFFFWKFLITTLLAAQNLLGYIDGSLKSPEKFIKNQESKSKSDEPNPSYETWNRQDKAVMAMINATISPSVLAYIVGCTTARSIWVTLEEKFKALSLIHGRQLRSDLQIITKGEDSIDGYMKRIEDIRYKLKGLSAEVDDMDIAIHALNGLPSQYNNFRTAILALRSKPPSMDELYLLLKAEESAMETTNLMQRQFWNHPTPRQVNPCQICHEEDHTAVDCFYRYEDEGNLHPY